MKTYLFDVNVLLALAWPHHVHHGLVHKWWRASGAKRWATCTQTQLGFIRISCNLKFIASPASPEQALHLLKEMIARKDHVFWHEPARGIGSTSVSKRLESCVSHGQISDAYLAAVASMHKGQLATLDRGLVSQHPDIAILIA